MNLSASVKFETVTKFPSLIFRSRHSTERCVDLHDCSDGGYETKEQGEHENNNRNPESGPLRCVAAVVPPLR